ncbi:MAG: ATP-dependent RecD-like DNA helicase [Bacilli bacterium]|nr:ATP-dependent RecD-like DNA helicase [Bacilli bacterium]
MYITGKFKREIFSSNTGYLVGLFRVEDTDSEELANYLNKTITFTGYFTELNEIDTYKLYGSMKHHEKYGEQFNATSFERVKPTGKNAIYEFLTSGLFKGIGEKKARTLVDTLGDDTLDVILNNPSNLILVPGITEKNITTLHNKLEEYSASYETVIYLTNLGFSTKDSIEIYNFYKERTKKQVEEDIYELLLDINNLTFKKIDYIALESGIEKDSIIRIRGAILYIMREISNTFGHEYYFSEELVNYLTRVLKVPISEEKYNKALSSLSKDLLIIKKDDKYYLKDIYEGERLIANRFKLLSHKKDKIKNINDRLKEVEETLEIDYNSDQEEAIKKCMEESTLVITGGPGTGKTTILKGIIELYKSLNKLSYSDLLTRVTLLAPTGRAAKRMSEKTNFPAYTIHRFLKWQKETNTFQVNEYNKSKTEFVIIDEASMIDTLLMSSLLKGISVHTKIIVIGDDHQLPSVGSGNVLYDLINSKKIKVCYLNELYRQATDSNILSLAYNIRDNYLDMSIFNKESDLTFIKSEEKDIIKNIKELSNTYKDVSYKEFQILVPMYKGVNGIDNINKEIASIFNPKTKDKKSLVVGDITFTEQDKVIQLINQPDDNVYNGDIGIIDRIVTSPKKEIYINYDDNIVKYTPSNFNNFRLAYSISIHKSQGSEFDYVVIPIIPSYNKMLYKKLIYTAVTRCKKALYIIGNDKSLEFAIKNNNEAERRTSTIEFFNEE